MSKEKREVSLNQIRNNRQIKVILISFKAGSTGKRILSSAPLTPVWFRARDLDAKKDLLTSYHDQVST
jgi:hypothetical protein